MTTQCPSLASMLINSQPITHCQHKHGWIETPDGRHFKPDARKVKFIKGSRIPVMEKRRIKQNWLSRLVSQFA